MSNVNKSTNEEETQVVIEGEAKNHKKNHKSNTKKSSDFFSQIDDYLHDFLIERAPTLPDNVKEALVRFMPIINMIGILISIYAALIVAYTLQFASAFISGINGYGYIGQVNALSTGLSLAIYGFVLYFSVKAQVGLQPKEYKSWKYLIFAQLFNALSSVLSFSLPGLFGNLIGLYLLYQIKGYYKK